MSTSLRLSLLLLIAICLLSCQSAPPTHSNRLPNNDAASVSPALKVYRNSVENRLGAIWYALCERYMDYLSVGTVRTSFEIPPAGGKPQHVEVIPHYRGKWNAWVAQQDIDELRAPPIPKQVLHEIKSDTLKFEESFTVFPAPNRGR
jgi:hypothetical protein